MLLCWHQIDRFHHSNKDLTPKKEMIPKFYCCIWSDQMIFSYSGVSITSSWNLSRTQVRSRLRSLFNNPSTHVLSAPTYLKKWMNGCLLSCFPPWAIVQNTCFTFAHTHKQHCTNTHSNAHIHTSACVSVPPLLEDIFKNTSTLSPCWVKRAGEEGQAGIRQEVVPH